MEAIESVLEELLNFSTYTTGHCTSGPRNAENMSKASFAEFPTEEIARAFLKAAGGKGKAMESAHGALILKPAKTKVNLQRDWALRKAEELVEGATKSGDIVKIEFKERCDTVNAAKAFTQDADELAGTFHGVFA